jgi:hypothetical protein
MVQQAIGEVLPLALGVAISPVPIIAVILMLFSRRATVNGPLFLLGWVLALAVVSGVAYTLADSADVGSSSSASDAVSWGKIGLGVLLLALARRRWAKRPRPGETAPMPKWMAGIDTLAPGRAFVLGVLLAGVNPKNLALTLAAATGLAQLGVTGSDAVVGLVVFVVVASITIAVPVAYRLLGGDAARAKLDELQQWLGANNSTVMAVLLLVFGVDLIAKGVGLLG